jgi:diacylglycerol O-acyltransferase 1
VHQWLVQHVYIPARRRGYSKNAAIFFVFLVSALGHELVLAVPTGTVKLAAFMAMMGQIPLIKLTDTYLKGHQTLGNIIFWISIVIGQPACVIMYYYYGATAA